MLLILEGADGAGKTTLATRLAEELQRQHPGDRVDVWHRGPPTAHPLDEYSRPLWDYRPMTGRHVICDRWHLGEVVYPHVLGRTSKLDGPVLWHVEALLRARGAHLVHVTANPAVLRDRLRRRGDDLIRPDQIIDVAALFGDAVARSALDTTIVRWRSDGHLAYGTEIALPLPDLLRHARETELRAESLNRFVTYVGPTRPEVLLLGDTRNVQDHSRSSPAFTPYPATSGRYLLSVLRNDRSRVGLANACDVDDPGRLWLALGRPYAVALGNRAADRLDAFGVPHGAAPHPQFIRRFMNNQGGDYAADLLLAALAQTDCRSYYREAHRARQTEG